MKTAPTDPDSQAIAYINCAYRKMVAAKMVFVIFFGGKAQIWGLPHGYVHDL